MTDTTPDPATHARGRAAHLDALHASIGLTRTADGKWVGANEMTEATEREDR